MTILDLRPMLYVEDLDETVEFYGRVLGFDCVARDAEPGWAQLGRDEVRLMVCLPNAHLPFEGSQFTGSFYFRVDDVEAWWRSLRDKAEVCYPLETFDYGMREFAIRDNNGYLLQFGQDVPD